MTLLLAFGFGLFMGIAITFLAAIFVTGSCMSRYEERMWREIEAEMDEIKETRNEITSSLQ